MADNLIMLQHSDRESKLQKILFGPQLGMLLYSVVDLRIPQMLASGPKTADELSQQSNVLPEKLERVLHALETEKLFAFNPQTRQFSNSELSEPLINDHFAKFVKFTLNPYRYEFYSVFSEILKSDKSAPQIKFNQSFNDFVSQNAELLEEYVETYSMFIKKYSKDIVPSIDLSQSRKVIEVGGRDGSFLAELAGVYRDFTGAIYEQTTFRKFAEKTIQEYNLGDRIKVASGNFIDTVPEGFDTVILKIAISEYSDQQLETIFRNCRKSVEIDTKLFLIDHLIDRTDRNSYKFLTHLDIFNLVVSDGKIRTKEELEPVIERGGFRVANYNRLDRLWLIEARAV